MSTKFFKAATLALLAVTGAANAQNQQRSIPVIAVTELAYEERVQEHFEVAKIKGRATVNSNYHGYSATRSTEGAYAAGSYSYLEQTELRNFAGDLRGAILKGGGSS